MNDDELLYLDHTTGVIQDSVYGIDNWGQSAYDALNIYVANTVHVDLKGVYLGASTPAGTFVWQSPIQGAQRLDVADETGGLAVDSGLVFYAPKYSYVASLKFPPPPSGLYAFDAASGAKKWATPATPASAISAGSGNVYMIQGSDMLTAYKQSDGTVAWTQPVAGAAGQAPALAGGRVIVAGTAGVEAFDAATGAPAWSAPISGAATPHVFVASGAGTCGTPGTVICLATGFEQGQPAAAVTTSIAIAAGTGTVIVTAPDGVHVLALSSGAQLWAGAVQGAMGPVREPVVVGKRLYVTDDGGLLALTSP